MRSRYAILKDKKVVPVNSIEKWVTAKRTNRHVGDDSIGGIRISTVFLGLDHSFGDERPQWFETMIFGGLHDEYCERYETWEEAEAGHKRAVEMVKANLGGEK